MKIWEPKPPGTLWATPGLLGTPLPLLLVPEGGMVVSASGRF